MLFRSDVFAPFTARDVASEMQLWLRPGERMTYAGGLKGLALDSATLTLKVVAGDDPSVLVHDPKNRTLAHMLVELPPVAFPVALGVLYDDPAPTFEEAVLQQNKSIARGKTPDLQALVAKGQSWMVEKEPRAE